MHGFTLDGLPATPWKNGGGTTRQVLSWPPGAGLDDFAWRVSVAQIASDGPFSRFEGVDRQIMLLQGAGVRLTGEGVDHRLDTPWRPFAFAGELALQCARLGGDSIDFNVMARRALGRARVSVLRPTAPVALDGDFGLLLVLHGACRLQGRSLAAGQGAWWAGMPAAGGARRLEPGPADTGAAAVFVRWLPRADSA